MPGRDGGDLSPDLYSRYRRGGRWRMVGDDVWYWRQVSAALICTALPSVAVVGAIVVLVIFRLLRRG